MPVLSDSRLETFAQQLLINLAADMPRAKAAQEAARKAGYKGSSLGSNSRKRAQRADVKARMAELAAPALARMQETIGATIEGVTAKLMTIINYDLGMDAVKVSDQIASVRTLAELHGWNAPKKVAPTNPEGTESWNPTTDVADGIARKLDAIAERIQGGMAGLAAESAKR